MTICSVSFFAFCAALAVVIPLLHRPVARQAVLVAANLVFLATLVPNRRSAAALAAFVVATYLALRLIRDRPARWLVPAVTGIVIVAFVFLKRYTFVEWMLPERAWQKVPEVLGLSYMLFKFIHMAVDQSEGQLAPFTFATYASYQLLFFTLTAGPIQRYNDFHAYWTAGSLPAWDRRDVLLSWNRLLTGMIKVGLLAPITWDVFERSRSLLLLHPDVEVLPRFAGVFYAYPVFMYLNFSGYTDIVVAAARLVGLILPENFDRPYLARNVIDYWNRWHISLTHWIRDYVFMASYKWCAERFPGNATRLGYGLLFFALFLSGLWHGLTAGFAVFGAIHGLGAAVNRAYGDILRSRLGRQGHKRYEQDRVIHWLAVLLTWHYLGLAFVFFSSGVEAATRILFDGGPRAARRSLDVDDGVARSLRRRGRAGRGRADGRRLVSRRDRVGTRPDRSAGHGAAGFALRDRPGPDGVRRLPAHLALGPGEGTGGRLHEVLNRARILRGCTRLGPDRADAGHLGDHGRDGPGPLATDVPCRQVV